MNVSQAPVMTKRLKKDGFSVTRIPMANLTKERLQEWVSEARAMWEDQQ